VEGRESVRELLRAQARQVRTVWLADDVDDPTIEELAARARVPVRRASRSEIEAVSSSPLASGVLAHAAPLPTVYLDDLGDPSEGAQTVLVVDHMTDAPLGALIRTAVFCGVTAVVLPRQRSSPVSPTATGAARGAIEDVKMVLTSSLPPALGRLRHHGFLIVGIDAEAPDRLLDLDVDFARSRVALVIDGRGRLDDSLRARCTIFAGVDLASGVADTPEAIGQRACIELARCRIPGALR
jgi:23S rRNA (guanosine2251-2'-O)-methyltransferase